MKSLPNESPNSVVIEPLAKVDRTLRAVIHDMRSPSQSLLASVDSLESAALSETQVQALDRVRRASYLMNCHLRDLATLLLIQQRALIAKPEKVNPLDLARDVAREIESALGAAHRIAFVEPQITPRALVDRGLLGQSLGLLIRLMLKRNKHGGIELSVVQSADEADGLRPAMVQARYAMIDRAPLRGSAAFEAVEVMAEALGGKFVLVVDPERITYGLEVPTC